MARELFFVIAAGLALSGCCLQGECYFPAPKVALTNWHGLPLVPKRHDVQRLKIRKTIHLVPPEDNSPTEEDLAKLRPYSKEWGAVLDAINSAADAKLKEKLI